MIALALVVLLVSYTEPTTYTNGAPLTDLDHCNIYVVPFGGEAMKLPDIPATSWAGGGRVTVPVGLPVGEYAVEYRIKATCTNTAAEESDPSEHVYVLL